MREMVVMGGLFLAVIVLAAMAVLCLRMYRQKGNENSYVFLSDTAAMGRTFGRKSDKPRA